MIILDYQDRRPLYEQIEEKIKELILCGILEEHVQLPSVRSLAMELSINPNTIQRAYTELERDKVIYSVKGKGSFIAPVQMMRDKKTAEIEEQLLHLIKAAKHMGISEDSFVQNVRKIYNQEGQTYDRGNQPNKTI